MSDPAVGAFGAVTLLVVVVARFGALASTVAAPLVVGALWCVSRTAMAVGARTMDYARPGGLATAFVTPPLVDPSSVDPSSVDPASGPSADPGRPGRPSGAIVPGAVGVVVAIGLAVAGRGWHGVAAVGGEVVAITAVLVFAQRRIGGFTGDVLGAAGVVGETVGLLVLAAKW
jgi:adenosylcobinamide-GDP ribazoletransferase